MKKLKVSLSAAILVVALMFVVSAQAATQKATLINSNGNKVVVAVGSPAVGFYFGNGYVLMTQNDVYTNPTIVGGTASPDVPYNYLSINGDTAYHITGSFKDATTTILSFVNPFGTTATSTVDLVRLDTSGAATSTYSMSCGASATAFAADSVSLLDSVDTATSTVGILENGLTAALGGQDDAGTVVKIALTPTYPYFLCTATTLYSGAFTEVTNTYAGKFTVRVNKQR